MLGPVLDEVISWILDEGGSQHPVIDVVRETDTGGGLFGLLAGGTKPPTVLI
jgi:hypothetical protein